MKPLQEGGAEEERRGGREREIEGTKSSTPPPSSPPEMGLSGMCSGATSEAPVSLAGLT